MQETVCTEIRDVTGPDSFTSANEKPAGDGSVGEGGRRIAIAGAD